MPVQVGDSLPPTVKFSYVPPPTAADDDDGKGPADSITSCGRPIDYDAGKDWADKKVVVFAVPGAFTPSCQASHLPGYVAALEKLRAKGVDRVAVVAFNDAWVMDAWRKANGVRGEEILFLSDPEIKFSRDFVGWTLGERTARYALVIDHGKVTYAAKEESPSAVDVSSAETVLANL